MCRYLQDSTFSYFGHISSSRVAIDQLLSHVQLFATPWTAEHQDSLSFTISKSLLKLMSIESLLSNHFIFCHPLLLLSSIFPSIRVFSKELALCVRWSKYWSFSFSISLSNEYSVLISFRIDWFDLLAVQHHSSKASGDLRALGLLPPLWSGRNTYLVRLCELRKLNLKFLV